MKRAGLRPGDPPVPIHFLTKENVLLFFKMLWIVFRSFWMVWLFLLACGLTKLALIRYARRRRG